MTNRGNTADKPRRNSGNQFSLATTETWKIIAERLRKKETEGVVRGGDSSYQPRLACKLERTSSRNWSCLGGGKVWGPCVILIGLMPTSYNTTHSHRSPFPSIFHPLASVFFSHPCWLRPLDATTGSQWPASLRRFKRENGTIRKVFSRQFLRPRHREAFHEFSFAKTISCRVCKRLLWHIRVSICLVGVFLSSDLSNFFLERRKSVSVRVCV